jgi:hypothetical protein
VHPQSTGHNLWVRVPKGRDTGSVCTGLHPHWEAQTQSEQPVWVRVFKRLQYAMNEYWQENVLDKRPPTRGHCTWKLDVLTENRSTISGYRDAEIGMQNLGVLLIVYSEQRQRARIENRARHVGTRPQRSLGPDQRVLISKHSTWKQELPIEGDFGVRTHGLQETGQQKQLLSGSAYRLRQRLLNSCEGTKDASPHGRDPDKERLCDV